MLEQMIANQTKPSIDPSKRKVLWIGECSLFHTGFAHMTKHYLSFLNEREKFNLVEFATGVGWNDARLKMAPWPIIPNTVRNQHEVNVWQGLINAKKFDNETLHWGRFRIEDVLRAYQPDIIVDARDVWNMTWILPIPMARQSTIIWQPMIDGNPHPANWLNAYKQVDHVVAFSHFAKRVLREEGNIRAIDVIPAGVNISNFRPLGNREELLEEFGLDPKSKIIGFVARNQIRKKFPEMIQAFAQAMKKNPRAMADAYLLLYTNYNDAGWPIHELAIKAGIESRLLVPLVCHHCHSYCVMKWKSDGWEVRDGRMWRKCGSCKKMTLATPSTDYGLSEPEFNRVYNLMWWYFHLATREGQGLPICESKAAGIPGAYNDTAALTEQASKSNDAWNMPTGAWLLRNADFYTEVGSGMNAAVPDREHVANRMIDCMQVKPDVWNSMSQESRSLAETCYDWNLLGAKWERILETVSLKTSATPLVVMSEKQRQPDPDAMVDEMLPQDPVEWVELLFKTILDVEPSKNEEFQKWVETAKTQRSKMITYFKRIAYRDRIELGLEPDKSRLLYVMPRTAGDVFLSTAVTKALKDKYPDWTIDFATMPEYMSLLEGCPWIDHLIPYEDSFYDHMRWEGRYDQKPKWNMVLTPNLVTQHYSHCHFHGGTNQTLVDVYANFCNVDVDLKDLYVNVNEDVLKKFELPDRYLAFQTRTGMPSKDWALWKFFADFCPLPMVQIGSKSDYSIITTNSKLIDLRGLEWSESFGVLKNAALLVAGDSVMGHVAQHLGVPSVTLWGATLPEKIYRSQKGMTCLQPPQRGACLRACHHSSCTQPIRCINFITPEAVLKSCSEVAGFPVPSVKTKYMGSNCQDYEFRFSFDAPFNPSMFFESPLLRTFSRNTGVRRIVEWTAALEDESVFAKLMEHVTCPVLRFHGKIKAETVRFLRSLLARYFFSGFLYEGDSPSDFSNGTLRLLTLLQNASKESCQTTISYTGRNEKDLEKIRSRCIHRAIQVGWEPLSDEIVTTDENDLTFSSLYVIDEKGETWLDTLKTIQREEEWISRPFELKGPDCHHLFVFEKLSHKPSTTSPKNNQNETIK